MAAVVVGMLVLGEPSARYFPMDGRTKYIYNRKNKSPEEWQFKKNPELYGGFECSVLNRINQADYSSIQEYYVREKKGIIKLAVSKDMGVKKPEKMRLLPERLKTGLEFDAGMIKNTPIIGRIVSREDLSTPVGDCRGYKIEYKAGKYIDMDVWYCKDVGVVRSVDRVSGGETGIISMVTK